MRGLAINLFAGSGIVISSGGNNLVDGNYIGGATSSAGNPISSNPPERTYPTIHFGAMKVLYRVLGTKR